MTFSSSLILSVILTNRSHQICNQLHSKIHLTQIDGRSIPGSACSMIPVPRSAIMPRSSGRHGPSGNLKRKRSWRRLLEYFFVLPQQHCPSRELTSTDYLLRSIDDNKKCWQPGPHIRAKLYLIECYIPHGEFEVEADSRVNCIWAISERLNGDAEDYGTKIWADGQISLKFKQCYVRRSSIYRLHAWVNCKGQG